MASPRDQFIKDPFEACTKAAFSIPVYGACSICPERKNCEENNKIAIQSEQYVQSWLKSCVEEKNRYAKYITYNKKEHRFECDWEMVKLEDKSIYEPENLNWFEKQRLKNAYHDKNKNFSFKKFFEAVADFFDKNFF